MSVSIYFRQSEKFLEINIPKKVSFDVCQLKINRCKEIPFLTEPPSEMQQLTEKLMCMYAVSWGPFVLAARP